MAARAGDEMTERDFIALAVAWVRHSTPDQRERGARFLGAMSTEAASAECARAVRNRLQLEREFEEHQLAPGPDLERRRREPS